MKFYEAYGLRAGRWSWYCWVCADNGHEAISRVFEVMEMQGAPEPPAIFIGSATSVKPFSGSCSVFATFSMPGILAQASRCLMPNAPCPARP